MRLLKRQGGVRLYGRFPWPGFYGVSIGLFVIVLVLAALYAMQEGGGPEGAIAVMVGLGIGYPLFWRKIMISMIGRPLRVEILPDVIRVKGRKYDRRHVRGFRIEDHHKGREEARRMNRRRSRSEPVYNAALEVVMDYGEQRVPIAAMPDRDERMAEALLYRLQSVHENLDAVVGGKAVPSSGAPRGGDDAFGPPPEIR